MLCQVGGLVDAGMVGKIARRGDDDAPHVAAEPGGNVRGIRQMANAQRQVDALVDEIDEPVEHE